MCPTSSECVCVFARMVCVAGILAAVSLGDSQRKPVLVQFTVNDSLPALHSPAGQWLTRSVCVCVCVHGFIMWPCGKGRGCPVYERSQVVQ